MNLKFEDMDFTEISPYGDAEVNEVLRRIVKAPQFDSIMKYIFPELSSEEALEKVHGIESTYELQKQIMHPGIRKIVELSSDGLTYSGFDTLRKDESYVFISNHRDIFLDSGILQILLFEHKLDTTEITFGGNLMENSLIKDIGKINKMFTVHRDGSSREMYKNTLRLSAYIRNAVVNRKKSIWIAQKNGRTKDGNDRTQQALLKMLSTSGSKDVYANFSELRIVPVAISYEYEPCDNLKVNELYNSIDKPYVKSRDEDVNSIVMGVLENKGRIHLALGEPFTDNLKEICGGGNMNDCVRDLTAAIDEAIFANYKLMPTNYIAYDLKSGQRSFAGNYSKDDFTRFEAHMKKRLQGLNGDIDILREMFLNIYANPVKNIEKLH